jgi:hypothetical protein
MFLSLVIFARDASARSDMLIHYLRKSTLMQWINVTLLLKNFLTFIVDKRPTTIKIPEFSSLPG